MNEFLGRLLSRLPRSPFRRALWLVFGLLAFWAAFNFGDNYGKCRAWGDSKIMCVTVAAIFFQGETAVDVLHWVSRVLSYVLP